MNTLKREHHWERLIARKAGIEGWRWYQGERVDGAVIYTGCVPNGVISKGPRKGWPRFKGGTHEKKVVVTDQELREEELAYARATGNCPYCYGDGDVMSGFSVESGERRRPCKKCNGTGKAEGVS